MLYLKNLDSEEPVSHLLCSVCLVHFGKRSFAQQHAVAVAVSVKLKLQLSFFLWSLQGSRNKKHKNERNRRKVWWGG